MAWALRSPGTCTAGSALSMLQQAAQTALLRGRELPVAPRHKADSERGPPCMCVGGAQAGLQRCQRAVLNPLKGRQSRDLHPCSPSSLAGHGGVSNVASMVATVQKRAQKAGCARSRERDALRTMGEREGCGDAIGRAAVPCCMAVCGTWCSGPLPAAPGRDPILWSLNVGLRKDGEAQWW